MRFSSLTFKGLRARPVVLKLERPIVARIATITDWPLILIDLYTEEGIEGRSYLEPYTTKAMKYLVPALRDLGEMFKGHQVAPTALYQRTESHLRRVRDTTGRPEMVDIPGEVHAAAAHTRRHDSPASSGARSP